VIPWHETARLTLDRDGCLWLWLEPEEPAGFRRLGPVESAEVPAGLEGELAEVLDLWTDRADDRAEQMFGRE